MSTAVKRRAPKDGYDNPEKRKYRHEVWKRLSKKALPILEENENAKVLMLPSSEGLEIDVAMKFGIKRHQIIAIDENPALLAHADWKYKVPKSNRFGCKVSEIGEKIKNNGWVLAAANLDFCNNFSDELITEINSFFAQTPIVEKFSFSVTMGKGRETKALLSLINYLDAPDIFMHPRLSTLWHMVEMPDKEFWTLLHQDKYVSNRVPMLYAIFSKLNKIPCLSEITNRVKYLSNRLKTVRSIHVGNNYDKQCRRSRVLNHYRNLLTRESDQHLMQLRDYLSDKNIIERDKLFNRIKDYLLNKLSRDDRGCYGYNDKMKQIF